MIAYGGISWQEPENTGFFQDVSLPGRQTPLGVKWHILAYAGISWHIIPCKSDKKSGKVEGRTTGENTFFISIFIYRICTFYVLYLSYPLHIYYSTSHT